MRLVYVTDTLSHMYVKQFGTIILKTPRANVGALRSIRCARNRGRKAMIIKHRIFFIHVRGQYIALYW